MSEKITAVSGENRFLPLQRLVAGLVLGTASDGAAAIFLETLLRRRMKKSADA